MPKLRPLIFSSCLLVIASLTPTAFAADLIAIIVSDTNDSTIGTSVKIDFENMRKEMRTVAKYTGLTLKEILMEGPDTNPQKFLEKIEAVTATRDDVIVFYFSGHGYRTASKAQSPWPNLFFSQQDQGIEYDYVIYNLIEKNPRFLITIADVCNSFISEISAPPLATRAFAAMATIPEEKIAKNYQHLFLEEYGMINLTGSQVGEYSTGNNRDGGAFTHAFLTSLDYEVGNATPANWATLIERAKINVINYSSKIGGKKGRIQHPYGEINIKSGEGVK